MSNLVVLSHLQAASLLQARADGKTSAATSLDLGLTTTEVAFQPNGAVLLEGESLSWESVEEIAGNNSVCYLVQDGRASKIQLFSDFLNRFYSLMPTERAPTLLISGIPMHRIKGINPHLDTLKKLRTISPLAGRVLDTCTGLGYTAIEAAKTAEEVITIELDPAVLEIARLNPWSTSLFENPRIEQIVSDSFEEVQTFEDESFSRIVHDPPMFSLAGDLYSGECYQHLFRVLRQRGRMFHYIGDLDSRSGRNVARGVVRRLHEAGFSRIVRKPQAFGVVAYR